ncbi:MAG TPA: outer membrane protein assembly factor BamD [Pyrinomonadaceae bacterium]|nr:outer membrane protein assembly factor BamD [Pyrinomonadaceae bacterium]
MKKFCLLAICLLLLFVAAPLARAQGNAKQGPDVVRDPDLEKDSLHNLEVARHYFKLKKAYIAALQRCEEIIAGNPVFSKIDEVLFIAGESSLRLAENKGKQASKVTSDKLREDARDYLSQLVNGYPDSSFRKQAEDDLKGLGGPKPKESKQ